MQGVNVVGRLVDPTTGRVSASCVSGFLFRGNAGNPITGYTNILGDRWDEHGSSDGSTAVGPYVAGQVSASGSAGAVRLRIARGVEVAQDFVVQGAIAEPSDRWETSSFARPQAVPLAGTWAGSISGYGDRDYYFFARAGWPHLYLRCHCA